MPCMPLRMRPWVHACHTACQCHVCCPYHGTGYAHSCCKRMIQRAPRMHMHTPPCRCHPCHPRHCLQVPPIPLLPRRASAPCATMPQCMQAHAHETHTTLHAGATHHVAHTRATQHTFTRMCPYHPSHCMHTVDPMYDMPSLPCWCPCAGDDHRAWLILAPGACVQVRWALLVRGYLYEERGGGGDGGGGIQ